MKRLTDPTCAEPKWSHLPWLEPAPGQHMTLMQGICRVCPAFDACKAETDALAAAGDLGVGFLAGRSQRQRSLEISNDEQHAPLLSDPLAATSNRG